MSSTKTSARRNVEKKRDLNKKPDDNIEYKLDHLEFERAALIKAAQRILKIFTSESEPEYVISASALRQSPLQEIDSVVRLAYEDLQPDEAKGSAKKKTRDRLTEMQVTSQTQDIRDEIDRTQRQLKDLTLHLAFKKIHVEKWGVDPVDGSYLRTNVRTTTDNWLVG